MVKILGALGVPVAIGVHGGTGAIFAVVKARPYWYTGLFPLIFIVSALASGGALLTFIYAFFGRKDKEHASLVTSLGKMVAGFLALDLIFLGSELLVGLYGQVPDHVAVYRAIMFGPFWYVFWGGQLVMGALIPLILILNRRTGNSVGWQHGFGHWALGHMAKGKGTVDGMFNKTVSDPISGMALHKEVCVKVYKA